MAMTFFTSAEWRAKRKEIIRPDTICAWCGSKDALAVCRSNNPDAEIKSFTDFRFEAFTSRHNRNKPCEKEVMEFVSSQDYGADEKALILKGILRLLPGHESTALWDMRWNDVGRALKCRRGNSVKIRRALRDLLKGQSRKNWQNFINDARMQECIAKEYESYCRPNIERYRKCLPEDIIILCRRCHFASRNGLVLCPVCRKRYKGARYPTCFDCMPGETKAGLKVRRNKEE